MRSALILVSAALASILVSCNLPTASTTPKDNSNSGPLITATVSDGSGAFSVHGKTTVDTWTGGQVQVSITGIEEAAPNRNITIVIYPKATDVGVAIPLNDASSPAGGQGIYGNGTPNSTPYSGPSTGTSGAITFDNLTMGTNTISGTFSFVARRPTDGAMVTVSNGTFGK
jgi:hypothetical protein